MRANKATAITQIELPTVVFDSAEGRIFELRHSDVPFELPNREAWKLADLLKKTAENYLTKYHLTGSE